MRLVAVGVLRVLLAIPLCAVLIGVSSSPAGASTSTVSGSVRYGPNGIGTVCVYVLSTDNDYNDYQIETANDGTYSITGIADDSYQIQFDPSCDGDVGSPFAGEWFVSGSTTGTPLEADAYNPHLERRQ